MQTLSVVNYYRKKKKSTEKMKSAKMVKNLIPDLFTVSLEYFNTL